jgi:hypothetical protein
MAGAEDPLAPVNAAEKVGYFSAFLWAGAGANRGGFGNM